MNDEVVGEMLISWPLPETWREAVATTARTMYAAYARHPWAIFVAADRIVPGPNDVNAFSTRLTDPSREAADSTAPARQSAGAFIQRPTIRWIAFVAGIAVPCDGCWWITRPRMRMPVALRLIRTGPQLA
jgi:Tetracyclin repressor-like, C-terminal domain